MTASIQFKARFRMGPVLGDGLRRMSDHIVRAGSTDGLVSPARTMGATVRRQVTIEVLDGRADEGKQWHPLTDQATVKMGMPADRWRVSEDTLRRLRAKARRLKLQQAAGGARQETQEGSPVQA